MDFIPMTHLSFTRNLSGLSESADAASVKSSSSPLITSPQSSRCRGHGHFLRRFTYARREGYDRRDSLWLRKKRMRLSVKVSLVLLLIVGIAAASVELFDRQYSKGFIQGNYLREIMAVVRQVGAEMTSPKDLHDRTARELEISKLRANRPDLLDVALYALPEDKSGQPFLVVNTGITASSSLERTPGLVTQALSSNQSISDVGGWEATHRVKVASPITIDTRLVGATYAEFSTSLFDELQRSQRRLELTRILIKGLVIVLAINLFLYFRVHRPVGALLSAVEAVSRGKLLTTVPVRGRDEIGQLAERFNLMVDRIRAAAEKSRTGQNERASVDFSAGSGARATAFGHRPTRCVIGTSDRHTIDRSVRPPSIAGRRSSTGRRSAKATEDCRDADRARVSDHSGSLDLHPQA